MQDITVSVWINTLKLDFELFLKSSQRAWFDFYNSIFKLVFPSQKSRSCLLKSLSGFRLRVWDQRTLQFSATENWHWWLSKSQQQQTDTESTKLAATENWHWSLKESQQQQTDNPANSNKQTDTDDSTSCSYRKLKLPKRKSNTNCTQRVIRLWQSAGSFSKQYSTQNNKWLILRSSDRPPAIKFPRSSNRSPNKPNFPCQSYGEHLASKQTILYHKDRISCTRTTRNKLLLFSTLPTLPAPVNCRKTSKGTWAAPPWIPKETWSHSKHLQHPSNAIQRANRQTWI